MIQLLQILEWNAAIESADTEAGDKAFRAGTVLTKKRVLVRVNDRRATLELELGKYIGTVYLA